MVLRKKKKTFENHSNFFTIIWVLKEAKTLQSHLILTTALRDTILFLQMRELRLKKVSFPKVTKQM